MCFLAGSHAGEKKKNKGKYVSCLYHMLWLLKTAVFQEQLGNLKIVSAVQECQMALLGVK